MSLSIEWSLNIQNIRLELIQKILESDLILSENDSDYLNRDLADRSKEILDKLEDIDEFQDISINFKRKSVSSRKLRHTVPRIPTGKKKGDYETELEDKAEKKPRVRKEIPDEQRCMCRTFAYEREEYMSADGKAKVMREDPKNLYGDRCKKRKYLHYDFCGFHGANQPYGIWNGEYKGRLLVAKQKAEGTLEIPDDKTETVVGISGKKKKNNPSNSVSVSVSKEKSKSNTKERKNSLEKSDKSKSNGFDKFGDFSLDTLDTLEVIKSNPRKPWVREPSKLKKEEIQEEEETLEEEYNTCLLSCDSSDEETVSILPRGQDRVIQTKPVMKNSIKKQEECLFSSDSENDLEKEKEEQENTEDLVETEPFIFEGIEYNMDNSNNLYLDEFSAEPKTVSGVRRKLGTFVGVFNHSKNEIIKAS